MPVPKGVDPKKHARCERALEAQGKSPASATRICSDSLKGQIQKKKPSR